MGGKRIHPTPIGLAAIKTVDKDGTGERSLHCWWGCKTTQLLCKQSLKGTTMASHCLPPEYKPTGVYTVTSETPAHPCNMVHCPQKTKTQSQPRYPSVDAQKKKTQHRCTALKNKVMQCDGKGGDHGPCWVVWARFRRTNVVRFHSRAE